MPRRYASRRYAGGLGPSRIRTRIPTTRQLGQWVSLRKILRFRVRLQLSQSRCLSLLLAMSGRVFLFLPPRGHEPPPTLRDRLNPNLSLYRHRLTQSPVMPNARMSLCTQSVHSFSFPPRPLRTAPSRFPNMIRFGNRPPLIRRSVPAHKSLARAQRCLNALAPGYLKGTVVRGHPVVWSLALRSDDAKQDPVVYGTKFGVVSSSTECGRCYAFLGAWLRAGEGIGWLAAGTMPNSL